MIFIVALETGIVVVAGCVDVTQTHTRGNCAIILLQQAFIHRQYLQYLQHLFFGLFAKFSSRALQLSSARQYTCYASGSTNTTARQEYFSCTIPQPIPMTINQIVFFIKCLFLVCLIQAVKRRRDLAHRQSLQIETILPPILSLSILNLQGQGLNDRLFY